MDISHPIPLSCLSVIGHWLKPFTVFKDTNNLYCYSCHKSPNPRFFFPLPPSHSLSPLGRLRLVGFQISSPAWKAGHTSPCILLWEEFSPPGLPEQDDSDTEVCPSVLHHCPYRGTFRSTCSLKSSRASLHPLHIRPRQFWCDSNLLLCCMTSCKLETTSMKQLRHQDVAVTCTDKTSHFLKTATRIRHSALTKLPSQMKEVRHFSVILFHLFVQFLPVPSCPFFPTAIISSASSLSTAVHFLGLELMHFLLKSKRVRL